MGEQSNFIGRIGNWFRRGRDVNILEDNGNAIEPAQSGGSTFLRPWARRDQAINHLQEGFSTLTDLMASVRDNLERQGQRQDELLGYLSHLPQAIQSIPEAGRIQGEMLKAIHQQLSSQNDQQSKLSEILQRVSETGGRQHETLEELRQSVDGLNMQDQKITDALHGVGSAMQGVSKSSEASAHVLENLRDNLSRRDTDLERVLQRQNTRFTTMLAIAIVLSAAALTAVAVIGYLMVNRMR